MVKSSGLPTGATPGQLQRMQQEQSEVVNKRDKQKAQQQTKEKLSSADAARLASQAGFQRMKKGEKKKGFDVGDGSSQQFSLPQEELDTEAWSQERLESAQGSLALANSQLGEVAGQAGAAATNMAATILAGAFSATEEDLAELEDLAERKPRHEIPSLEEISGSISNLFGIQLGEDVPVGHKVLAAGLVVAGEPSAIKVDKGKLGEPELAAGMQKVTKRGNQAVSDAQRMNKGVSQQLNLQRTFVFKR